MKSFATFLLAGLLMGLAGCDARAWSLAWCGVALFAFALGRAPSRIAAALGGVAGLLLLRGVWLSWAFAMAEAMTSARGARAWGLAVGMIASVGLCAALVVGLAAFIFRDRLIPLWLPLAWALGDTLQVRWTGIANDWLSLQAEVRPVMSALAAFGLWPTTLGCWFGAACLGVSLAQRSWRPALGALATVAMLALAPSLPEAQVEGLERVGVVHLKSEFELPPMAELDDGLDLVVWPETTLATRRRLSEGSGEGVRLDTPLGASSARHLVGAITSRGHEAQNSALLVDGSGRIEGLRAKRGLMPGFERTFLGFGPQLFAEGHDTPLLSAGALRVIPLICGEVLRRDLVAEGKAAGATLLAVLASDQYQANHAQVQWQVLAHLRLRAIEFHVPAVYASRSGRSAIVASNGAVLARSDAGAPSGLLRWRATGAEDLQPRAKPSATVLYSKFSPELRPDCPPGACTFHAVEEVTCTQLRALEPKTLIVAGHAMPPKYLFKTSQELAALIGCANAELVVLDMCFGASAALLLDLSSTSHALVVGASRLIDGRGFHYDATFFGIGAAAERARHVTTNPATALFIGQPQRSAIEAAIAFSQAASGDELRPRVRQWSPTLVGVDVEGGEVAVEADWKKIGTPPISR